MAAAYVVQANERISQDLIPSSRISVVFTPTGPLVYERKQIPGEKLEARLHHSQLSVRMQPRFCMIEIALDAA
jgi:hypothetical protein